MSGRELKFQPLAAAATNIGNCVGGANSSFAEGTSRESSVHLPMLLGRNFVEIVSRTRPLLSGTVADVIKCPMGSLGPVQP